MSLTSTSQNNVNKTPNVLMMTFMLVAIAIINLAVFLDNSLVIKSAVIALSAYVFFTRKAVLFNFVLFLVLMSFSNLYIPEKFSHLPIINFLMPLLLSIILILPIKEARNTLSWLKLGLVERFDIMLIIVGSITAILALVLWAHWSNYLGIGSMMMQQYKQYPVSLVILGIIIFATVNALTEEAIYRGIIQTALIEVFKPIYFLPILLQSMLFASAHYQFGFPNGKVGYLMTLIYGCFLGYMRLKTKSILISSVIHFSADLCIGLLLYSL